ncbi:MAG: hypothetical protein RJB39_266 [Candidatus Parcubacteria bacterium]|jgi:orotate phosphoribosyltransferase
MHHLINRLKEIGVIYKAQVTLRSGQTSEFYCDMKKAWGHPDILNGLADEVGKRLPEGTTCVAASGYGGLPLGAVVASRFNLKFTEVRNTPKEHGKAQQIDGYIPGDHDLVVIVDDVLTTGHSIQGTIIPLQEMGIRPHSAVIVIKRENPEIGIPYAYVFEVAEIL